MPRTATDDSGEFEVTYVYLVYFGDYVKVGMTNSFERRFGMLQHGVPEELTMPWFCAFPTRALAREYEIKAHRALAAYRTRGEWFKMDHEEAMRLLEPPAWCPRVTMSIEAALALADGPVEDFLEALAPVIDPGELAYAKWKAASPTP